MCWTELFFFFLARTLNLCWLFGKMLFDLISVFIKQAVFYRMLCLQTWTRLLGTQWMPMKPPRCTRTFPSSCCRTTSLPAAFLSITSSVYVKLLRVLQVKCHYFVLPMCLLGCSLHRKKIYWSSSTRFWPHTQMSKTVKIRLIYSRWFFSSICQK